MKHIRSRLNLAAWALALSLPIALGACSSGNSSSTGGGGNSSLSVGITDAPSDDIDSFTVDITSLQLHKQGGAVVSVISTPVHVDLAQFTDTTQLLNALTVPAGLYTSATITVDFSNAQCFLVGHSLPAAIVDASNSALNGAVVLPLQFPVTTLVNKHHLLEFDFDLDQSVTTDTVNNKVTVEPSFVLRFDAHDKPINAVGTLVSVDVASASFVAQAHAASGAALGTITIVTDANTIFHIDGAPAVGATGLALLASKSPGTAVQAQGDTDPNLQQIAATYVEAGTGTYNGGSDIVEGLIVDRVGGAGSNAMFTVLGHSSNAPHTIFQFNTPFTVNTAFGSTHVERIGSATVFDTDDLDVGQHVRVFGNLAGTTMTANSQASVVREQLTRLHGTANAAIGGATLTMTVDHVDLRPQSAFTWAHGGGTTPPDPNALTVDVGTLGNGLGIMTGTKVTARGFFPAINSVGADFVAASLVNQDDVASLIFVRNRPNGFTVALATLPASIQITITNPATTGEIAVVDHGLDGSIALPSSPTPTITPAGSSGVYILRDKTANTWTLYTLFADFSAGLQTALGQGAQVDQLSFVGIYTAATNSMTSALAYVTVQ